MVETTEKSTHIPRIGDPALLFKAVTTRGKMKLDDFRGKWLALFSHPADFMPVGTTEFIDLAKMHPAFIDRKVELLGLSTDRLSSHIACMRNTEEILRIIDALQTSDLDEVSTPANWKPGDPVIIPAPLTRD
jgi:peroxiredoxin 2/4